MSRDNGDVWYSYQRARMDEATRQDGLRNPPRADFQELIDPRRNDPRVQTASVAIQQYAGCSLWQAEAIAIAVIEDLWARGDLNGNRPGAGTWLEETWESDPWD